MKRRIGCLAAVIVMLFNVSCAETWLPPVPAKVELARGLVVFYPGSFNTKSEMVGFYTAFRDAGVEQAIEVMEWAPFLLHIVLPDQAYALHRQFAEAEADRLVAYMRAHPDCPVTLLGFSGGTMIALMVAEAMPEGMHVDSVILMSSPITREYDLTKSLQGARQIMHYWSPWERVPRLVALAFPLLDNEFGDPAASFGFAFQHERLIQLEWTPEMLRYFHAGDHMNYWINVPWIRDFIAPFVAQTHE